MKENKSVILWLLTGCFMIMIMVVIGGITRLTGSGLSMVEWKPIMGFLPPMGEADWIAVFEKYQESPQFKLVNSSMILSEFKVIFFWEYFHRVWGRLIGILFLVPFIYFLYKGKIRGKLLRNCLIIFGLGGLQGLIGWIMVKSGLIDIPEVSHYRLALHLITAFFLYCYILWIATNLWLGKDDAVDKTQESKFKYTSANKILLVAVGIQIIYGAFMSGLKAGFRFPTFPLMNGDFIPPYLMDSNPWYINFLNNKNMIQFMHRYLALFIAIYGIYIAMKVFKNISDLHVRNGAIALLAAIFVQITLGAITAISFQSGEIPVFWGVVHQWGALVLLTVTVFLQNRLCNMTPKV